MGILKGETITFWMFTCSAKEKKMDGLLFNFDIKVLHPYCYVDKWFMVFTY